MASTREECGSVRERESARGLCECVVTRAAHVRLRTRAQQASASIASQRCGRSRALSRSRILL
eukprot:2867382-Prymnesium_polylepis.1